MKRIIVLAFLWGATAAHAQQQEANPEFLKHAITAVVAQRNQAQDEAAMARAQLGQLQDALAKAQARIKELEARPAPQPSPPPEPAK